MAVKMEAIESDSASQAKSNRVVSTLHSEFFLKLSGQDVLDDDKRTAASGLRGCLQEAKKRENQ